MHSAYSMQYDTELRNMNILKHGVHKNTFNHLFNAQIRALLSVSPSCNQKG